VEESPFYPARSLHYQGNFAFKCNLEQRKWELYNGGTAHWRKGTLLEKGCYWWSEYGNLPPEDEHERVPSPSAVLESYRMVGKVAIAQLAEEMQISVQMVRRIFHKGDGLDSIQRRQRLSRRLDIPPELLGLDGLHWDMQGTWWVKEGYHAFGVGEDGYPHAGSVVRWYRKQKRTRGLNGEHAPWKQEDLGEAFVPSLSTESVNKMERHGIGLDSMNRRRALVALLGIPPALLGLDAMKQIRGIPQIPSPTLLLSGRLTEDVLLVIEQRQEDLHTQYLKHSGQDTVGEIKWWIPYLQDEVLPLTRNDQQHLRVRRIEQHYHGMIKSIAIEQLNFAEATLQANTNVAIAEEMADTETLIVALRERARTYREQGPLFYDMAQADTNRALALTRRHAIAPPVAGVIKLEAGVVQSFTAQIKDEREVVKSLLQQAERLSRQAVGEVDTHQIHLDPGYYHLNAAVALLGWYNPTTFKEHLDEATRLTKPGFQRHHLRVKILRARGELLDAKKSRGLARDEHYAEATSLATEAFDVARSLNSRLNRSHIQQAYNELKKSPYGEEPTVAHLGLLLELWP